MFFQLADPIRYSFEQKFIPESLFKYKKSFVTSIVARPNLLWTMLNDMYKNNNLEMPYESDELFIEPFNVDQNIFGLKLNFPTPETPTLSYYAYIFYDSTFDHVEYFCIEKMMLSSEHDFGKCLCSISQQGRRSNYGLCNTDVGEDLDKALELYLSTIEDNRTDAMMPTLVCLSGIVVQNLPMLFYDDPKKFIVATIAHKEIVFDVLSKAMDSVGLMCPYEQDYIVINAGKISDTLRCASIMFQHQEMEYRYEVVCLFNNEFENPMYFISVRDTAEDEEVAAVIYIDEKLNLKELDKVSPEIESIIGRCVDEYYNKYN